jgi:hypothetical protein
VRRLRIAGTVWLLGALPVGFAGWMLLAVSDHSRDNGPGAVLLALAVAGGGTGARLLARPGATARRVSLALSALWLLGAVLVLPRMAFPADQLWASGLPAVVGLATALLAVRPGPDLGQREPLAP